VLKSLDEIMDFASDLMEADEGGISIDGMDEDDRPMEKAVATVCFNTEASLPDTNAKAPFLALILWVIGERTFRDTVDTVTYCFNLLHGIAPTGFDTAKLLLLSQCDPDHPDDFVPLQTANWSIIFDAVNMLESQKHRKKVEAKALLRQMRESVQYERIGWARRDKKRQAIAHEQSRQTETTA
jgi:hypothetical protein